MDIIQVVIFIIIIFMAIVQQISKANKEKRAPSPQEVLEDMFPETEQENMKEELSGPPTRITRKPHSHRMQHRPVESTPTVSLRKEKRPKKQDSIKLSTKNEARRAFIYSEIFNRKY